MRSLLKATKNLLTDSTLSAIKLKRASFSYLRGRPFSVSSALTDLVNHDYLLWVIYVKVEAVHDMANR